MLCVADNLFEIFVRPLERIMITRRLTAVYERTITSYNRSRI